MEELRREKALNEPPKKRDIVKGVFQVKSSSKSRDLSTQGSITKRSDTMIVLKKKKQRSYQMHPKKYFGKRPTIGLLDGSDMPHGLDNDDSKKEFINSLRHRLAYQIMKEGGNPQDSVPSSSEEGGSPQDSIPSSSEEGGSPQDSIPSSSEEERSPQDSIPSSSEVLNSSLESECLYHFEKTNFPKIDPLTELPDPSLEYSNRAVVPQKGGEKSCSLRRQRAVDVDCLKVSSCPEDGLCSRTSSKEFYSEGEPGHSAEIPTIETPVVDLPDQNLYDIHTHGQAQLDGHTDEQLTDDRRTILTWLYSQDRSSQESGRFNSSFVT